MIWVTRERPVIDRIACPWLILRRIDPQAQFLFLPPADVLRVATAVDGIAFDIEGGRYAHDGPLCTFDVLIREYRLDGDPALVRVAEVVRAADTAHLDEVPQAAGLLAFSFGLRRVHQRDQAQLEAGLDVYDALYAWSQHDAAATHNWPSASGR